MLYLLEVILDISGLVQLQLAADKIELAELATKSVKELQAMCQDFQIHYSNAT